MRCFVELNNDVDSCHNSQMKLLTGRSELAAVDRPGSEKFSGAVASAKSRVQVAIPSNLLRRSISSLPSSLQGPQLPALLCLHSSLSHLSFASFSFLSLPSSLCLSQTTLSPWPLRLKLPPPLLLPSSLGSSSTPDSPSLVLSAAPSLTVLSLPSMCKLYLLPGLAFVCSPLFCERAPCRKIRTLYSHRIDR